MLILHPQELKIYKGPFGYQLSIIYLGTTWNQTQVPLVVPVVNSFDIKRCCDFSGKSDHKRALYFVHDRCEEHTVWNCCGLYVAFLVYCCVVRTAMRRSSISMAYNRPYFPAICSQYTSVPCRSGMQLNWTLLR